MADCTVVSVAGESAWKSYITWLLVFAGWVIVHFATLNRDRRKEKREASKQLCSSLLELQGSALDFHTAPHCDVRRSTDLAQQVEHILLQLEKAPLNELGVPIGRRVVLRQSITRKNVDPSDFMPQQADSELMMDIRNAVTDMIFAIEDAREQKWA